MSTGFLWIIIASIIGFGIAAICTDLLKLRRNVFLLFYVPVVGILFFVFLTSNQICFMELIRHNFYWGLLGAFVAGAFVLRNVFSQPSSPKSQGSDLLVDVLWPGMAYGLMDSLLLSVIPVLSVRMAFNEAAWIENGAGKIGFGILALLASFLVTTVYHWGFPEFRGKRMIWPNIGNGVLTLAFLFTMNPLAAILPHMAMHVAAMVHGRETTGQVPPHYNIAPELR